VDTLAEGRRLKARLDKEREKSRALEDELYDWVIRAREDRYTPQQIGETVGLSKQRVSQILNGQARRS
jgi:hypothetical protein